MLGRRLRQRGHAVRRIVFNGGDSLFGGGSAISYRGGLAGWPAFLDARLDAWGITDLVLFGDCRPLHRAAIALAQRRGIVVHAFEEGYLRPNWLTLEHGGVNGHSSLPRDPAWYVAAARSLPPWRVETAVPSSFRFRACLDVLYNLANLTGAWAYPAYRSHKPWHPLAEYRSGAQRFFGGKARRRRSASRVEQVLGGARPYYLLPLQLEADSQIRFHSPLRSMAPAIEQIVDSFARSAPPQTLLLVTEHPLDFGVIDLQAATARAAAGAGVADRVLFLHGGSPEPLIRGSRGLVTVNSTVGILALSFGVPVKTVGEAIYDLPGLCTQGPLDQFWSCPTPPDAALFDCFRRAVAAHTQVNGGLYGRVALVLAADAAAAKLSGEALLHDESVALPLPATPAAVRVAEAAPRIGESLPG